MKKYFFGFAVCSLMKQPFLILSLITLAISANYAQPANTDSLEQARKIELIRYNVQKFFASQHKRFSHHLKGLNQEYALYYLPTYYASGHLSLDPDPHEGIDLLNIKAEDIFRPFKYYKPGCFEKPLNVTQQIIDYSELLLRRTQGNWCEDRFGYTNLEIGDEFGILLIFSPKNIPDSLSALKVTYYVPSEYETASDNKKRMMDLFVKIVHYTFMGEGLNERFIRVVLKY